MRIILIILFMLMVLVGCSRSSTDTGYMQQEYVYIADYLPFPNNILDVSNPIIASGRVYFTSSSVEWLSEEHYHSSVYSTDIYAINADATGITKLTGYAPFVIKPANSFGGYEILDMHTDSEGNLWILENWLYYDYDLPANFAFYDDINKVWEYERVYENGSVIRKLDSNGTELFFVDLSSIIEQHEGLFITSLELDNQGNIYIAANKPEKSGFMTGVVYVFDNVGKLEFDLSLDKRVENIIRLSDGSVALIEEVADTAEGSSQILKIISFETCDFGELIRIPDTGGEIFSGSGIYDFLYSDFRGLFGYKGESNYFTEILDWLDSDITIQSRISGITLLSDERIICINGNSNYGYELLVFTKTLQSELPEKTTLTLLTFRPDWYRNMVAEFNKSNSEFRIAIIDYSGYIIYDYTNWTDDWSNGIKKLNTELMSGMGADILDTARLPCKEYAARGFLADLYPLIDADPTFSRNDFVEGVFRVSEIDGNLHVVSPNFRINTIIGHPYIVGPSTGWTLNDFQDLINTHPKADIPLGKGMTKVRFMEEFCMNLIDDYVNWEAGTAHFNSDSFIQLLRIADTFPNEPSQDSRTKKDQAIATGRQIIDLQAIYGFHDIQICKALFNGEFVFKGYPNDNSNGNLLLIDEGFAITTSSVNKDAAWTFIRTVLSKEHQLDAWGGFPTNQDAFNVKVAEALQEGFGMGIDAVSSDLWSDGLQVEDLTQADINQVTSLIKTASGVAGLNADESIWNIINEEASAYFNGTCSAEDAARIIQSRVSLYVSERS